MLKQLAVTAVFLSGAVVTIASALKSAAKTVEKAPRPLYSVAQLARPLQRGGVRHAPSLPVIENEPGLPSSPRDPEEAVARGKSGRKPDESEKEFRARRKERRSRKKQEAQTGSGRGDGRGAE